METKYDEFLKSQQAAEMKQAFARRGDAAMLTALALVLLLEI